MAQCRCWRVGGERRRKLARPAACAEGSPASPVRKDLRASTCLAMDAIRTREGWTAPVSVCPQIREMRTPARRCCAWRGRPVARCVVGFACRLMWPAPKTSAWASRATSRFVAPGSIAAMRAAAAVFPSARDARESSACLTRSLGESRVALPFAAPGSIAATRVAGFVPRLGGVASNSTVSQRKANSADQRSARLVRSAVMRVAAYAPRQEGCAS